MLTLGTPLLPLEPRSFLGRQGYKALAMVKRYAHLSEAHTGIVERMSERVFRPMADG